MLGSSWGLLLPLLRVTPLSKEVSTPSISFTESVLEVASLPSDEGVTGPVSELASTLGCISEEEVGMR